MGRKIMGANIMGAWRANTMGPQDHAAIVANKTQT
jgi:hypothetical protein